VAHNNAQALRDDSIPEDFNPHSALLVEHITSQEQINTKFAFSIVSYMPFPVCVCIYIYIYIHTHTHTHIYTRIYVCVCVSHKNTPQNMSLANVQTSISSPSVLSPHHVTSLFWISLSLFTIIPTTQIALGRIHSYNICVHVR
jgi:hypothetical protein